MIFMLPQLAFNCVFGFLAHLIRDLATGHMSRSWEDICNYSIGVLSVFPLSLLAFSNLRSEVKSPELRYLIAYTLSFISFGLGVVIGHWYQPIKRS